jgi:hypothetical protein
VYALSYFQDITGILGYSGKKGQIPVHIEPTKLLFYNKIFYFYTAVLVILPF